MSGFRTAPAVALLGALLVRSGRITQEQLEEALDAQSDGQLRLGELLVQCGWLTNRDLAEALAEQFGVDFFDLRTAQVDEAATATLPEEVARRNCALPIGYDEDGVLLVALSDPADAAGVTSIRSAAGRGVRFVVAEKPLIVDALDRVFGGEDR